MPDPTSQLLTEALRVHSPTLPDGEAALGAALAQLTGRPGKLLRARLLLGAARSFGWDEGAAVKLAVAVEYFHVASLALDDLPCMDDALERRGQPCVHRQHGDATAILAALALINRAYFLVNTTFADRPLPLRHAAAACLDRCLGPVGLVGGQARDLAFARSARSAREIGRIALAKSAALFGLAVMLPALAGEPQPEESRLLRALCMYWGLVFQLVDDLRDVLSSSTVEGKTTGRDRALGRPNLALALGVAPARARLARLEGLAQQTLARLAPGGQGRWSCLAAFQVEVLAVLSTDLSRNAA